MEQQNVSYLLDKMQEDIRAANKILASLDDDEKDVITYIRCSKIIPYDDFHWKVDFDMKRQLFICFDDTITVRTRDIIALENLLEKRCEVVAHGNNIILLFSKPYIKEVL